VKKKVRKFASGGDIITGLGAVLIGKALYDKYKGGSKDDEDSDYARKAKEFRDKKNAEAAAVEPKAEPKTESREEYLEKRGAKPLQETGTRANPYYTEDEPAPKKSVVTTTPKKAASTASAAKKTTPAAPAAKKAEPAPKSVVFKPAEDSKKAESPVSKKAESPVKLALPSNSKPDLSTPKGFDMKGTNKTAYGTDTTSVFQKKAAQERAEAEEKAKKKAKEQANIRSGESERMMRESLGSGFKRGGAVKKYASGGSVSSASKRADGIAQRGKTKGRIC
jgi:colicin import membrane protein